MFTKIVRCHKDYTNQKSKRLLIFLTTATQFYRLANVHCQI